MSVGVCWSFEPGVFHCSIVAYLCKHSNLQSALYNCSPEFEIKCLLRDEMLSFSKCILYGAVFTN